MKKRKITKKLKVRRISISNLNIIKGGRIRKYPTTSPTDQTYCFVCDG